MLSFLCARFALGRLSLETRRWAGASPHRSAPHGHSRNNYLIIVVEGERCGGAVGVRVPLVGLQVRGVTLVHDSRHHPQHTVCRLPQLLACGCSLLAAALGLAPLVAARRSCKRVAASGCGARSIARFLLAPRVYFCVLGRSRSVTRSLVGFLMLSWSRESHSHTRHWGYSHRVLEMTIRTDGTLRQVIHLISGTPKEKKPRPREGRIPRPDPGAAESHPKLTTSSPGQLIRRCARRDSVFG